MSLKLHHGFRFTTTDFMVVHERVMQFRQELQSITQGTLAGIVAKKAVNRIDRTVLGLPYAGDARDLFDQDWVDAKVLIELRDLLRAAGPKESMGADADTIYVARSLLPRFQHLLPAPAEEDGNAGPFMQAYFEVSDRLLRIERRGERDPEVDYSCSISIIPHAGKLYGLIFTEQPWFQELWFKSSIVEPYTYWNNYDPPEGVSHEEWDDRGAEWRAVLSADGSGGYEAPALRGFSVQITDPMPRLPMPDEVLQYLPTFEQRVAERAKDIVLDRAFRKILEDEYDGELPNRGMFKIAMQSMRALQSEEGQHEVKVEAERIRPLLPIQITREILIDGIES